MWREVRRVLAAEWVRVRNSRAMLLGLLAFGVIVLGLSILYLVVVKRSFIGIPTGFYVAGSILGSTITPVGFAAVLIVSFSLGREFSSGTIQQAWVRPLSRRGWLVGKLISSVIVLKVFLVLTLILVLTFAGLQFGYSSLMEKEYLIHSAGSLWWSLVLAVALTWVALIALVAVVSVCALYAGSPGTSIALAVGIGFATHLASNWEVLRPFVLPTYLSTPLNQFAAMAKGLPLPEEWGHLVRECGIGSLVWLIAAWLWAMWIVKRKEVLN